MNLIVYVASCPVMRDICAIRIMSTLYLVVLNLPSYVMSKQRELKRQGLGNLAHKSEAITDEDIEKLWECDQLGATTPESIINTLWFFTTVHFGMRSAEEHRNICWGDIKLDKDSQGQEFLEFVERQTKTRTGENPRDVKKVKPKMWANSGNVDRCPIAVYKQYSLLRPLDFSNMEDPFYLATNTNQSSMKKKMISGSKGNRSV